MVTEHATNTMKQPFKIQTDLQRKTSRSESDSNQELSRSLLLDILPSDSSKWAQLFSDDIFGKKGSDLDGFPVGVEEEDDEEKKKSKKKKKRRRKKKRLDPNECSEEVMKKEKKEELVCLYPFTTSTSATQRKIKQQYDQFVKSHESLTQVERFINCLVESKKELEHRSKVTERKFTIAKALLLKADRSSFDRISQQICKLASEQKRIVEDASVYNWHRKQLKLSPAYKKMLEISKIKEMKAKSCEKAENMENETDDISFEDFLAQEKKDSFWQRRKI